MDRNWLSPKEVASAHGVHYDTVRRWIKRGLVYAERVGKRGRWKVDPDSVRISSSAD